MRGTGYPPAAHCWAGSPTRREIGYGIEGSRPLRELAMAETDSLTPVTPR